MVKIRKAKLKNFKKIAKILAEEFSKPPYKEPWTLQIALKKIKIFSRYCDIWEIIYNKEIVGFIVVNPNHWFPGLIAFGEDMAIKKEFQNKGIGTDALKQIWRYYSKKGFETFMGIGNKNSKAFKVWINLGIKESKENKIIQTKIK